MDKTLTTVLSPVYVPKKYDTILGLFINNPTVVTLDLTNMDLSNITSARSAFSNCAVLEEVTFNDNFDASTITNFYHMFYRCPKLKSVNVSNWDVSKVTTISGLFYNDTTLSSPEIGKWDTSNVEDMSWAFRGVTFIPDVENWNTSNVTNMRGMLCVITALTTLDLSKWDVSKVIDMRSMFNGCSNMTSLILTGWDTSNVLHMSYMLESMPKLTTLDVSFFDTRNVLDMCELFYGNTKLASLDVSKWVTSKVTDMSKMFCGDSALATLENGTSTNLETGVWDTSNVTDMSYMFYNCLNLVSKDTSEDAESLDGLDVSGWNTSNLTNLAFTFYYCSKLTNLDLSKWDVSNVTDLTQTFRNCTSLKYLKIADWDVSKVKNFRTTFYYTTINNTDGDSGFDISKWNPASGVDMRCLFLAFSGADLNFSETWKNTSNVTDMSYMFNYAKPTSISGVENFNTSSVTTMAHMFTYISGSGTLNVANWDTSKVTKMGSMFYGCGLKITGLDTWDVSNVIDMSYMFTFCGDTIVDSNEYENWDVSNVTNMAWMFYKAKSVTRNLSKWDVSNVTNMNLMFEGAPHITTGMENWDVRNVVDMDSLFDYNQSKVIDVTKWEPDSCTNIMDMFIDTYCVEELDLSKFYRDNNWNFNRCISNSHALKFIDFSNWDFDKLHTSKPTHSPGFQHMFNLDTVKMANCTDTAKELMLNWLITSHLYSDVDSVLGWYIDGDYLRKKNYFTWEGGDSITYIIDGVSYTTTEKTVYVDKGYTSILKVEDEITTGMFEGNSEVTSIDLTNFYCYGMDMTNMFKDCTNLETITFYDICNGSGTPNNSSSPNPLEFRKGIIWGLNSTDEDSTYNDLTDMFSGCDALSTIRICQMNAPTTTEGWVSNQSIDRVVVKAREATGGTWASQVWRSTTGIITKS